jgi:hypothetical protein
MAPAKNPNSLKSENFQEKCIFPEISGSGKGARPRAVGVEAKVGRHEGRLRRGAGGHQEAGEEKTQI